MKQTTRTLAVMAAGWGLATQALAASVGWQAFEVPTASGAPNIPVALYYPTLAPARAVQRGLFTVHAAMQAAPDDVVKGLIVLSHGASGIEVGHSSLAEALAQRGYLVAAPRHPGDNWEDRSLMQAGAAIYFTERPKQLSRVIDALLGDPAWRTRIATDAHGPRIGALGHSMGGYTVLALAGARPDPARYGTHCAQHRMDDPVFCSMGKAATPTASPAAARPALGDSRVRAVVALAPAGAMFQANAFADVSIPVAVYAAEHDRFNVPRFHAEWIHANLPGSHLRTVKNAGHYAFMDAPSIAIQTPAGDLRADPPGFDRPAFLKTLGEALSTFFDEAWSAPAGQPPATPEPLSLGGVAPGS